MARATIGVNMKKSILLLFVVASSILEAQTRTSADYSLSAEAYDAGGAVSSSANYSVKGASAGMIATLSSVSNPSITNKSGYVGRLYDVQSLSVNANPTSVNSAGTTQLSAAPLV